MRLSSPSSVRVGSARLLWAVPHCRYKRSSLSWRGYAKSDSRGEGGAFDPRRYEPFELQPVPGARGPKVWYAEQSARCKPKAKAGAAAGGRGARAAAPRREAPMRESG